jgi:multidrug efflux pump subunit AcrA (membrane-fusion protein)
MGAGTRRLIVVGLVVALVAVTAWVEVTIRGADDASRTTTTGDMRGTEGLAGLEGMNMGGDGTVQLTADQLSQFGITFGTVDMRMLENEVRTVGVVTFDETRIAQVAPKFGGFVERLHVDFTGQPVRTGQPLLEIYSPELVAAQEELLVARRLERTMDESAVPGVPAGSSNLLAAAKRRLRLWDISEAQIEDILRTGEVRRALTLHAPATGVVVEKNVVEGQAIQAGQTLYTIADLSEVWIDAELREAEAGSVREGSGATIELAAFPGRPFKGRVEYVYPTLQEVSRTLRARVAVANSEGRLKPGMYATLRITTPTRRALTVPASAVIRTGERSMVFVDMGGGSLMPHEVETGSTGDEFVEVLSGVEPGQRVVTSAQFLLDSESNLAEVMKAMMGQMGSGDLGDMKGVEMPGMQMPESSTTPRR